MNKNKFKETLIDIGAEIIGSVLLAIGIFTFAEQADIAPGGIGGIAIMLKYKLGLPVGIMTLALNIPLILLAWRYLGKKFTLRTLRTLLLSTLILDYVITPYAYAYEGDRLLGAIACGVCMGAGLGIVFYRGSTTGGVDIISCLVERKYPHLQIGSILMAIDVVIIGMSVIVFGNIESALYGIVALYGQGRVMDTILYGTRRGNCVMIFSKHNREISREIIRQMDRGCTLLQAKGGYSREDSEVLMCAAERREYEHLRRIVRECDPSAFFVVSETQNVYGEGFQPIMPEE